MYLCVSLVLIINLVYVFIGVGMLVMGVSTLFFVSMWFSRSYV